jgi:DNA-binding NarL/FixJ family response regulator
MVSPPAGSRVYIVYQNALFAEGIRSLLQDQPAIKVVGAATDRAKALKEIKTLRPSVVLIEESQADPYPPTSWALLHQKTAGRVVALDPGHNFATVYDRRSVHISAPADLVKAVRGRFEGRGGRDHRLEGHSKDSGVVAVQAKPPPRRRVPRES